MYSIELKIRSRDIKTLIDQILANDPDADIEIVKKSYEFANKAHKDQKRLSGEPYIIHPLEVAITLAILRLDPITISAALLHDVVEDTGFTLIVLEKEFGKELALLVDGVTKISDIKSRSKFSTQAENLRKMLFATVEDIRVIIIKLADKLHNMRTLMFQPKGKQLRIARETLDIYAPIAKRLGMSKISSELEDISFNILYPAEHNEIKTSLAKRQSELDEYFQTIKNILTESLSELDIKYAITSRAKHYYSIYRKMINQNKTFDEIYDIRAIRIIAENVKDCYGILGVAHALWLPIIPRFKDYIAVPKSNMYQSLHTTVIGPEAHPLEIQIRTYEMHVTAEMGIAAHWLYKEDKSNKKTNYKNFSLLNNIKKQYSDQDSSRDFMTSLKMDLYEAEIFVFTPQGKIVKLSKDSTPVDFAYYIHTEVGEHTTGSRVNNRMVPLRTKLKNGDIIEILTSKNGHPSESWLKFVTTPKARYKIRNWLKKNSNKDFTDEREEKKDIVEKVTNGKEKKEEITAHVKIPEDEYVKLKKYSKLNKIGVIIDGTSNIEIKLSQCCQPIPGDDVVGYITRGRGITVHKKICPSFNKLKRETERLINIEWKGEKDAFYPVKLNVKGIDRKNLLKDVADKISSSKTNILKIEAEVVNKYDAEFKFILEVKNKEHLNKIIKKIKKIKNITDAYKLNEKVIISNR